MTHTETHSPLPWKFRIGELSKKPYVESRGDLVCGRFVEDDVEEATGTANAKLIVRSVNALPSLVEALEKAQECFEGTMRNRDYLFVRGTTVLEDIEAALALAKGE